MSKKRRFFIVISFMLTFALMCVIFYLSHQQASESSELSDSFISKIFNIIGVLIPVKVIRKTAHACEFCLLAFLFLNSLYLIGNRKWHIYSFIFTLFYACTDEFHQLFIAGRAGRASDVFIDSAGAVIGIAAYFIIIKIIQSVRRRKDVRNKTV